MEKDLSQAYKQAPWRIQIQRLGFILIGVIVLAGIAGFYFIGSSRAIQPIGPGATKNKGKRKNKNKGNK